MSEVCLVRGVINLEESTYMELSFVPVYGYRVITGIYLYFSPTKFFPLLKKPPSRAVCSL